MDFKTFLENFDAIAEAPSGIQKLRSLILDLAVRGKLVPQNPEDEPAVALLKRIQDLRTQSGRKPKASSLSSNEKIDLPKLPESWAWCRVEQIATVCLGSTPSRKEPAYWGGHIPWVSSGEVANCRIKYTKERITKLGLENSSTRIYPKETVLIAIIGQGKTRGQSAILDIEACTNQNVAGLVFDAGNMLPDYVWKWALSEYEQTRSGSRGGAQPALNGQKIRDLLIPVPPLAEQKRIVEKVEELMGLCDRYEAAKQRRDNLRQKLRGSAITSLMNAETDEELEAPWAFVRDNWHNLSQQPEDVSGLRKSVLELAVRGKLVPQNSEDETAKTLHQKIKKLKEQALKEKKIQKDKDYSSITSNISPWEIPTSWAWIRLQDAFEITRGGSPRPSGDPQFFGGDIPWITVFEITKDSTIYLKSTTDTLTELGSKRSRFVYPDDLLLTNSGATLGVPKISKIRGCINDGVAKLFSFHQCIYKKYAYYYLLQQTPIFRKVNQGMGQPNLNTSIIAGWFFPLPPLAEQKRIVAKVDELMQLCDQLEASLRQSQQRAESLAASAISHLTI